MVEKLRSPLPLRLAHGLEDPGLGHAVEVTVDRRLPACLDHIEIDRTRHQIGMCHAAGQTTGGDASPIGVHLLMERVDPEAEAMRQKGETAALIENRQIVPERRIIAERQISLPGRVTFVDQLRHHAVL